MKKNTLFEEFLDEFQYDPDYQLERLILAVNQEIRCTMREKDISQRELAKRMGISQPCVAKLLNLNLNPNLTLRSMARISCALEEEWSLPRLFEPADQANAYAADTGPIIFKPETRQENTNYEPQEDDTYGEAKLDVA